MSEMKSLNEIRSKSAIAYRDADFADNPNGYSVGPFENRETTAIAFEAGWDECIKHLASRYEAKLAAKDEIIGGMTELLESIRSYMCLLADRDELPMMISDQLDILTKYLASVTQKLEAQKPIKEDW